MPADDAERTEPPTPKRIEDARKRGEVANSRDLSGVVVLVTALLALGSVLGEKLVESVAWQAREAWAGAQIVPTSLDDFHALLMHHLTTALAVFLPLTLTLMAAGVAASLAQTGPLLSAKALAFRGSRIDPLQGMKRMVSAERLFDLGKALIKVGVVAGALFLTLRPALDGVLGLVDAPPAASFDAALDLAARVGRVALASLAVLALIDLAWVRSRHRKKLRMTLREVRDELREREGSPQIRARRRALQRELSRQRMIADVARADVVVTNPTHYAVALSYVRAEMSAPRVLARGRNHLAERIRRAAREHGVPLVENPPLARVLYRATRVGREVPEHLFQAVAEVLAYVYRLDRRRAAAWGPKS